jgi:RimJ/RimL family protein N-acetyltransferase
MSPFDLQPTLRGAQLELRPLREEDWDALYQVASDPLIWEQHPSPDRYQEPVFRKFFAEAMQSRGAFAVIDARTGEVVGSTRYYDLDPQARWVLIGYTFLKRDRWGGAINREMKGLLLAHAFKFVPAVRFHVGEANLRSRKAMEKLGGRLVEALSAPSGTGGGKVVYEIQNHSYFPRIGKS